MLEQNVLPTTTTNYVAAADAGVFESAHPEPSQSLRSMRLIA